MNENIEIRLVKSPVVFEKEGHIYKLGDKVLQGITSTLIHRAYPHKYDNVDPEVLAAAAARGTALHEAIQDYDRFGAIPDDENAARIENYRKMKEDFSLKVLENEYIVSDNERYATAIDIVVTDTLGKVCLIDTKTTYTLDKASTALQLSICKRFFEQQNEGLKVERIFALWMPNKDMDTCSLVELASVDDDTIDALIKADINDEEFVISPIPEEYNELEAEYRFLQIQKAYIEEHLDKIRTDVIQLMKKNNLNQIKSGTYTVSYIPEKKSQRFDSAAFKKENADLYKQYMKESVTAETIRFLETKKQ